MVCVFVCLGLSSAAHAAMPAHLVGSDLRPQKVFIQSLGEGYLTYFDEDRNLQAKRVDEFLAIWLDRSQETLDDAPPMLPPLGEPGVVYLTDGQRLVGEIIVDNPAESGVRCRSTLLGSVDVDLALDRINFVSRNLDDKPVADVVGDRLTLTNGDVVQGFVESVTTAGWRITPDGVDTPLLLPHPRVRSAQLANPIKVDTRAGYMAHVHDGSALLCSDVSTGEKTVALNTTIAGPIEMFVAWVQRIDLPTKVGRLAPFSNLTWRKSAGGEVFGLPVEPVTSDQGLHLHAPVTITVDLPEGARRFATVAKVAATDSDAAEWTDMAVILKLDGKEVARHKLDAKNPEASINVRLSGLSLTIEIDPGINGPIMDRLLLEQPVILIRE